MDKMPGLPGILSLFCSEFIRFNNNGSLMFYINYHITYTKNTLKSRFGLQYSRFRHKYATVKIYGNR